MMNKELWLKEIWENILKYKKPNDLYTLDMKICSRLELGGVLRRVFKYEKRENKSIKNDLNIFNIVKERYFPQSNIDFGMFKEEIKNFSLVLNEMSQFSKLELMMHYNNFDQTFSVIKGLPIFKDEERQEEMAFISHNPVYNGKYECVNKITNNNGEASYCKKISNDRYSAISAANIIPYLTKERKVNYFYLNPNTRLYTFLGEFSLIGGPRETELSFELSKTSKPTDEYMVEIERLIKLGATKKEGQDINSLKFENSVLRSKVNESIVLKNILENQIDSEINSENDSEISDDKIYSLIKQRAGQWKLRKYLLETSFKDGHPTSEYIENIIPEMMIASHIKPYSKSNDSEKYDPNNVLLLDKLVDGLFDKGLITFDKSGKAVLSQYLIFNDKNNHFSKYLERYNKPVEMNDEREKYMKYHRDHIFIDSSSNK